MKDAAAYAVMMGIGETYLSAFALFLKGSTPQIGLLASLPPLLGSLAQVGLAFDVANPGQVRVADLRVDEVLERRHAIEQRIMRVGGDALQRGRFGRHAGPGRFRMLEIRLR